MCDELGTKTQATATWLYLSWLFDCYRNAQGVNVMELLSTYRNRARFYNDKPHM
jgi:hypothetical protein